MREAFIGFDSAWAGKVPGGIVWATFEDQHLAAFAEPRLAGFKDAAQIIETLRSECDYVLVAVDQPTVVPNERAHDPLTESLVVSSRGSVAASSRPTAASRPCSAPTRRSGGSWNVLARPRTLRWRAHQRTDCDTPEKLAPYPTRPVLASTSSKPSDVARLRRPRRMRVCWRSSYSAADVCS